MADPASQDIGPIQTCLEALVGLVRTGTAPVPMRHEARELNALLTPWLQAICCLNLSATHPHSKRVLQFLQQKFDTVNTALAGSRALRFDVLMLAIVRPVNCVSC